MQRSLSLDILIVILAFMVVAQHANFLIDSNKIGNFLTINGLFRVAVPFFFIISGYYFLSISTRFLLLIWLKRIILLYLSWMLFYVYFWFHPKFDNLVDIFNFIKVLVFGYGHLWYLPGMIGAGLLSYIFRERVIEGTVLAIILYCIGVLIQYAGNYQVFSIVKLNELANMEYIHRSFLFFAFPFFYCGLLINKSFRAEDIKYSKLITILIIGIVALLSESYYNYSNPLNNGGFDNYFALIFIVPTLFILVSRCKIHTKIKGVAQVSTAIYLIHPLWIVVLKKMAMSDGTLLTIVCFLFSCVSSIFLIAINRKVRFIL